MRFAPLVLCALLPLLPLLISAAEKVFDVIHFSPKGLTLSNVSREKDERGRTVFAVSDLSYQDSARHVADVVLSFNTDSAVLARDDTRNYIIRHASYDFVRARGVMGRGGAHFYKRDHRVEIEPERNLWLGNCTDLGSFTIEFRFLPFNLREGSVLFSRIGYASGKRNGIEIVIRNRRPLVRFAGVFSDETGRRRDIVLAEGRALEPKRWYHFMVSFDRLSGRCVRYLNGKEEQVIFLSPDREPYVNVYRPSFECSDLPPAVIGKDFYGYMDEFRISHMYIRDLKRETEIAYKRYRETGIMGRHPVNREGIVTSPVYGFPLTGTGVTLFRWKEILKKDTFVWMEFRTADDLFPEDCPDTKWYRITNNQRNLYLKREGDLFLRGKYYQWRAHLVPSPNGRRSPRLYDVEMHYRLDPPPKAPVFVEVSRTGDRTVRLKWNKNVEHDIHCYKIYYGLRPRKYDGVISLLDGRLITNGSVRGNTIEVEINDRVIQENRERHRADILRYPVLENNVLYYFAVSACDSYRPDTKYNHESALSKEITGRPFAGSDVDGR